VSNPFLLGQDVAIRVIKDGTVFAELNFAQSFNDAVNTEIKESGHLGEKVNRFTEILNGYSFDFEALVNTAAWLDWQAAVIARAQRVDLAGVFVIVRVDQYSDGTSQTITYEDVAWGEMPTSLGSRGDFMKVKGQGKCSRRTVAANAFA
jgi:hypothetical protein